LLRRVLHEQRVRPAGLRGGQLYLHREHVVLQPQLRRGKMRGGDLLVERVGLHDGERVLYGSMHRGRVRSAERIRWDQRREGRRRFFERIVERRL
jgi:hypothetical protein